MAIGASIKGEEKLRFQSITQVDTGTHVRTKISSDYQRFLTLTQIKLTHEYRVLYLLFSFLLSRRSPVGDGE
jgi:hypothetical protein